jgi:hypothetical protein
MGVFSDLLSSAVTFDITAPSTALARPIKREIQEWIDRGDVGYPAGSAVTNEVQSLAITAATTGNFTLTVLLASGETFTTANILFNAAAATIETAIDSAATTASVVGWTNGDITVSGGVADANPVVFTYDGASVAGLNHSVIVATDVDLSDGTPGVPSTTTEGQTGRKGWGALVAMGVASASDIPVQGVDPVAFTPPSNPGDGAMYPSQATIMALANEAAAEDNNLATIAVILASAGIV